MNTNQRVVLLLGLLVVSVAALGCANNSEVSRASLPASESDLARAPPSVAEAEQTGAVAITRNRETQQLVTEVRSGLQTLEDELRRGTTNDPAAP